MNDQYECLNKAQLSFEYLHTNSTTHTFLFGALAELIDNARDAQAKNLQIFTRKDSTLRGGFSLNFLDDGCGMNYDDVLNIIIFGKSGKRNELDSNQIGRYGNGLKSGAMRLANDLILFTKKDQIGTCLFLSRTFHQEEHISQIMCPMPCFDLNIRQAMETKDSHGIKTYIFDQIKHQIEMNLIYKYSPFKNLDNLLEQFDLIQSSSGTLIVLHNLKLSDNGETELDIKTDPYDILIDSKNRQNLFDDDEIIPPEYRSFRAYVSILYSEPRMRISIQNHRVITKKLSHIFYKPRQYQFKSSRFKTCSEQEIKKCENEIKLFDERIREIDSQIHHLQKTIGVSLSMDEKKIKLRKLQIHAEELKETADRLRKEFLRKKSTMNTMKVLTFFFGFNLQNRANDGVFIYNCGRLIKMYEKIGQPNKKTLYCRGIVGIVDIPSTILEPTHNKQSFADEKEYHFLLKNLGEYMRQYWLDTGMEHYVKEFWESYGYRDDQLERLPSNDSDAVKRRQLAVPMLIQCNQCLKWRKLPYTGDANPLTETEFETWQCSDSPDLLNNSCSINEKLDAIPEGELKSKVQIRQSSSNRSAKKQVSNTDVSQSTIDATFEVTKITKNKRKRSVCKPRSRQDDEEKLKHKDTPCNTSTNDENISDEYLPPPTIGARVWTMYQGARRSGTVLTVNDKRGVFKMRFDDFPTAQFDYTFSYKSPEWSYIDTQSVVETIKNENEPLQTIAKKFKTLIKFMLPPNWQLTREEISSMSYDDLSQFDINVFMQTYRDKMIKVVQQRKTNEERWRTSTERLQSDMTDVLNFSETVD